MEKWLNYARELGFSEAAALDPKQLKTLASVRDMCAADKCGAYGKNWTCPPACGPLSQWEEKMHSYPRGLLLQTVGTMRKAIDSRAYRETEQRHLDMLTQLFGEMKKEYPDALCLGAGGCRVCKRCAYPESCRFPDRAMYSMEGCGLFVTQVCRDCGVPYHHGERTITYTGCILY